MNKIATIGIIFALIFAFGSFVRYFVIYPDVDRAIVYCLVGLNIAFTFYVWGKTKKLQGKFDYFEEKVQDMREEMKKPPKLKKWGRDYIYPKEMKGGVENGMEENRTKCLET